MYGYVYMYVCAYLYIDREYVYTKLLLKVIKAIIINMPRQKVSK